jgi:hypothetical protein
MTRGVEGVLPGESATARAAHESLKGNRRGIRRLLPFLGPAFIAAVAYVDSGNFATNISGGAQFGYLLLWVILASNLMAMLIQSMSAKLGIATGKNSPEVCRARFPRPVTFLPAHLLPQQGRYGRARQPPSHHDHRDGRLPHRLAQRFSAYQTFVD